MKGNSWKYPFMLLILLVPVFIWSLINPVDYSVWFLETLPVIIGVILLIIFYRKFKFSNLTYIFIFLFMVFMLAGGHYAYGEVPLFNWIRDSFGLQRNHFDRFGHFLQGFVFALIFIEILIKKKVLNKKGIWLFIFPIALCLSLAVFTELFEWLVTIILRVDPDLYLGWQGDIWDAQWDMLWNFIGALTSSLFYKFSIK